MLVMGEFYFRLGVASLNDVCWVRRVVSVGILSRDYVITSHVWNNDKKIGPRVARWYRSATTLILVAFGRMKKKK